MVGRLDSLLLEYSTALRFDQISGDLRGFGTLCQVCYNRRE